MIIPVSDGELRHALLKFKGRVIVERPRRVAAGLELGEESVAQGCPTFP